MLFKVILDAKLQLGVVGSQSLHLVEGNENLLEKFLVLLSKRNNESGGD